MKAKRVKLKFMIDPEHLTKYCYVPKAVRVRIIDPEAIFLTGILGESGRQMVKNGLCFYFTRDLAERLIHKEIAEEAPHDGKS